MSEDKAEFNALSWKVLLVKIISPKWFQTTYTSTKLCKVLYLCYKVGPAIHFWILPFSGRVWKQEWNGVAHFPHLPKGLSWPCLCLPPISPCINAMSAERGAFLKKQLFQGCKRRPLPNGHDLKLWEEGGSALVFSMAHSKHIGRCRLSGHWITWQNFLEINHHLICVSCEIPHLGLINQKSMEWN